jgi:hypothetical protein
MAQYPAGLYESRSARIRIMMYAGAGVVVLLAIVAIILIRGPETEPPPAPPAASEVEPSEPTAETPAAMPAEAVEPNAKPEKVPAAVAVTEPPGQDTSQLIAQAMALLNEQPPKIIEARDRLNELLPMTQGQQRAFVKEQLALLADKWLFSNVVFPLDKLCTHYRVSPGDVMETIGRHYNVPHEILMQINGIDRAEALQAGATIKAINGPFHARVYRTTFTMDLFLQNTYVKSFPVGLGKPGMETPTGRWRVKQGGKLVKPVWTDPISGRTYHPEDADYPLGSRWIALEGIEGAAVGRTGFAIHGTKDPQQIGTPDSQGCIRLHNGDAILMYNLLMPGVSLVEVVD